MEFWVWSFMEYFLPLHEIDDDLFAWSNPLKNPKTTTMLPSGANIAYPNFKPMPIFTSIIAPI